VGGPDNGRRPHVLEGRETTLDRAAMAAGWQF
jgi:hypothetical protein